jgi:hypothetical protein
MFNNQKLSKKLLNQCIAFHSVVYLFYNHFSGFLLKNNVLNECNSFRTIFWHTADKTNYVMKTKIIIIVLISLASCKALDKLTMFDLKYDASFTIPKNSIVGLPIDLTSPDVTTNTEEQFAVHDTRKDLIESIKLKTLTLQTEDPRYTFRFLKSVEIYLKADGLPEIKIAEKVVVPDDVGSLLQLDVTDADLIEYLKKDTIAMRTKTITDEVLTEDLRVKIHSVFRVDAKILGL